MDKRDDNVVYRSAVARIVEKMSALPKAVKDKGWGAGAVADAFPA